MAETMYAAPGVGLAATQIGGLTLADLRGRLRPRRRARVTLRVFVNPQIVSKDGSIPFEEGCLSFPTAREEVERAERVRVRAQNVEGEVVRARGERLVGHRNPA